MNLDELRCVINALKESIAEQQGLPKFYGVLPKSYTAFGCPACCSALKKLEAELARRSKKKKV